MKINLNNELIALDKDFDQNTSIGGVDVWASYFADDGVMVIANGEDLKGKDVIHRYMAKVFALPHFSLRWEPIDAKVSEDGSLGYTYGKYIRKYVNEKGTEIIATGKYTTVWQRQNNGSWRIILDIGN